jgi:uncharacterized protein
VKDLHHTEKSTRSRADALFKRANEEWDKGRLRSAFRLFLSAARAGDAGAQANLGYFYDVGIGRKPNRRLALHWYGRAFRQGYSAGATNTGTIYRDQGQTRKALTWFQKAVRLGDADANLEIAKLYLRQKRNIRKAIPYLIRTIKASSGTEVTEDSRREARRLLKQLREG